MNIETGFPFNLWISSRFFFLAHSMKPVSQSFVKTSMGGIYAKIIKGIGSGSYHEFIFKSDDLWYGGHEWALG